MNRVREQGDLGPEQLVDLCLDLMGPMEVTETTRQQLVGHADEGGVLTWSEGGQDHNAANRVAEMLQLIVATREYQYA